MRCVSSGRPLYTIFILSQYIVYMRILVVEDNQKLASSLVRGFTQEGYAAECLFSGEEAEKRIRLFASDYDIVVMDVTLPMKSGVDVCRSLRKLGVMVPIIMLTARDTIEDKINGLDSGADDYLVKPFSFSELLSRVRAIARRPYRLCALELVVGDLLLKPATREVFKGGVNIELTLKEFRLLELFMGRPGEVLDRQQIIDRLWDIQFNPLSRVMDVHINNLRNKIGDANGTTLETIRGLGYRLKA